MQLKKQVFLALLVSFSLVTYIIELQLPTLVPLPGIKLGLANLFSLCTLILFGIPEAFTVLLLRIVLSNLLIGQLIGFWYSLVGGLLSLTSMSLLYYFFKDQISIWAISIMGAFFHHLGQLLVASFVLGNLAVFIYLPFLITIGSITGYFIGISALFLTSRLKKLFFTNSI